MSALHDFQDEALTSTATSPLDVRPAGGPVAIEVRNVSKSFRIPIHELEHQGRTPEFLMRKKYRDLPAVRDVSFDIHAGEFFGIVGRNGSGKSTLLKILASIYRPDSGRVRVAGRIAPFIELGVGINPELTARESCDVGGVIMGLSRREAHHRLDAVLDFAELRDYAELKIKNYSTGMLVRLAFAIMIQADADIMLIDEVLAVGDAAFYQKCMDVFYARRANGKTIVLVTHDMSSVQTLCHRAMVIHDGEQQHLGDPRESAKCYFRLNFPEAAEEAVERRLSGSEANEEAPLEGRVVSAELVTESGAAVAALDMGAPMRLEVVIEANRKLVDPVFAFHVVTTDGRLISGTKRTLRAAVTSGQHVRLAGSIENLLVPGSYRIECLIHEERRPAQLGQKPMPVLEFSVRGATTQHAVAALGQDIRITPGR